MKKSLIIILAAVATLVSCRKACQEISCPDAQTISITASAGISSDEGKAYMGELSGTRYPLYFDENECIFVREFIGVSKSQDTASLGFLRNKDLKSGVFSIALKEKKTEGTYNYVAVYPSHPNYKTSLDHGVRYGGTSKETVSYILNHTIAQIPMADGPDNKTHVMIAKDMGKSSQATSLSFAFKPVVSYGKMTITKFPALAVGESISQIKITAPAGKIMTGRLYHNVTTDEISLYPSQNSSSVMIDPKNITFNTTGFAVWFTTFPFGLAAGDILKVEAVSTADTTYTANLKLSKALAFEYGKVSTFTYDWEKGQPEAETKTITFDFSACPSGWPSGETEYRSKEHQEKFHTYTVDNVDYVFSSGVCTDVAETSTRSICWGYNGTAACEMFIIQAQRYFGLPALAGWKLVEIQFPQALGNNSGRMIGITDHICANNKQEYVATIPEGAQACKTQGTVYTIGLTASAANTRYYMAASNKGTGLTTLTLKYEKVDD